jgi:peptide/nickel transport system substrate-binding protein
MALALLATLIVPVVAQDATPEPGKGGIIIDSNFGGDINGLNPLLNNDTASNQVIAFLFPAFIGVDPTTALFAKDNPNAKALVKDWSISDDGKVYTFKLRDDWKWNDGTPITSADVLYSWDAAKSGEVNTVQVFLLDIIDKVEAPDANTVVVTFKNADCTALNNAGSLTVVPSHALPKDFKSLNDDPSNTKPTVTQGIFNFGDWRPAEQVSLTANQSYPGTINGFVLPEGWVYKVVPDQSRRNNSWPAKSTSSMARP